MQTEGYEQYEISNFAKKGFISQHNSAYWRAQKYLGLGPSAHSYNGDERSWNIANNAIYLREMKKGIRSFEKEVLSSTDKFNDYVLTRLRTKWGLELDELEQISPEAFRQISPVLKQKLAAGVLVQNQNNVRLAPQSLFIADAVSADLFC
jgi:oxygen-independent coproporphyrinogen-3 oxidase